MEALIQFVYPNDVLVTFFTFCLSGMYRRPGILSMLQGDRYTI